MYTYEQPNLDTTKIVLSAPRVFAAVYSSGSPVTFDGTAILDVSAPPTGWTDVGVVEGVAFSVTKNWAHSELGVPKTRRKSVEIKRESKIDVILKEFLPGSLSLMYGTTAKNILKTQAATTMSGAPTRTSVVVASATGLTVGTRVCTDPVSADLIDSNNRAIISAVDGTTLTLAGTGFPTAPSSGDYIRGYDSIEMVDPMGAVNERTLLAFFDWEEASKKRQIAIWFPRVTAMDAFSPDLKGGDQFADAKASFEALATTQTLEDGTSKSVQAMMFFFD